MRTFRVNAFDESTELVAVFEDKQFLGHITKEHAKAMLKPRTFRESRPGFCGYRLCFIPGVPVKEWIEYIP